MKKPIFAVFALIAIILTLVLWKSGGSTGSDDLFPKLAALRGFDVERVRGKPFLLHFWAKWCEPCAEEIPSLIRFTEQIHAKKSLRVLAVSLDPKLEDSLEILPQKGRQLPPGFILALDPDHAVAESIGSWQYPETYLVDAQGRILEKWVGPQAWQKPEVLEFFLKRLP